MNCVECGKGISKGVFDNGYAFVETVKCRGSCNWKVEIFYPDIRAYWRARTIKETLK